MSGGPEILRYAAFTDVPDGGNPAGIVLDASGLDDAAMQRIAAEVDYAETAFITATGRRRAHRALLLADRRGAVLRARDGRDGDRHRRARGPRHPAVRHAGRRDRDRDRRGRATASVRPSRASTPMSRTSPSSCSRRCSSSSASTAPSSTSGTRRGSRPRATGTRSIVIADSRRLRRLRVRSRRGAGVHGRAGMAGDHHGAAPDRGCPRGRAAVRGAQPLPGRAHHRGPRDRFGGGRGRRLPPRARCGDAAPARASSSRAATSGAPAS